MFTSKIFIDGGDTAETLSAKKLLGFIDGQTTNPSLIVKNPAVSARIAAGNKFTKDEIWGKYKEIVAEFSDIVDWSVSVEPYADENTSSDELVENAREIFKWTPKVWVKLPTTSTGLKAAEVLVKEGVRLNMTLCFSEDQAAAIYSATLGAKKQQVFVSPFVGRLDDRGEDGMSLIANIMKLYSQGDGHVMLLSASLRSLDHLLSSLQLKSDIVTIPFKVFQLWSDQKFFVPDANWKYDNKDLKTIPYKGLPLAKPWEAYDISHNLTSAGLAKFASDWKGILM